jgi:hypothetical protein
MMPTASAASLVQSAQCCELFEPFSYVSGVLGISAVGVGGYSVGHGLQG